MMFKGNKKLNVSKNNTKSSVNLLFGPPPADPKCQVAGKMCCKNIFDGKTNKNDCPDDACNKCVGGCAPCYPGMTESNPSPSPTNTWRNTPSPQSPPSSAINSNAPPLKSLPQLNVSMLNMNTGFNNYMNSMQRGPLRTPCEYFDCSNITDNVMESADLENICNRVDCRKITKNALQNIKPEVENICDTVDCGKIAKNALREVSPQLENICDTVDCGKMTKNILEQVMPEVNNQLGQIVQPPHLIIGAVIFLIFLTASIMAIIRFFRK